MTFILTVLGALLVLEGIPYFTFPSKVRDWALMLADVPDTTLRVIGGITMATGLVLLFALRLL